MTRDLLLVGGGHAHAVLLRMWGMNPLQGVRITLVNPGPTTAYSGMLPGYVAGHYQRDDLEIDLVRLARFAGARLVMDQVIGLNPESGSVRLSERPDIQFDIASIDIGVTSGMGDPAEETGLFPVKPLWAFAKAWEAFLASVQSGDAPPVVRVIGAGLGGLELAMAMAWRLKALCSSSERPRVCVLEKADRVLPAGPSGLRRVLSHNLKSLGIEVRTGVDIRRVEDGSIHLATGEVLPPAFVAAAAGAQPARWLGSTGLALENGFIRVDGQLRSISHPKVFAVGDIAHLELDPRPKAGVYAVRQGPVLFANLRAALSGRRLRAFRPQGDHLKLVSLGSQAALAEKWGLVLPGNGLWPLKNRIDRRFMTRLNQPAPMAAPIRVSGPAALGVVELETAQPLCGGCGSKVSAGILGPLLRDIALPRRADVLQGQGDDAAVLALGDGRRQVLTTDHFRAFSEDPYVMARIVAQHALGDIWAMGAEPQAALASLVLPAQSAELQARMAAEILQGLQSVLQDCGADLVGGHTSLGAEFTLGLSLTGLLENRPALGLGGASAGDRLVLTRPIGVGVVMAAEMQGRARGEWVAAALQQMQLSNGPASRVLRNSATAMTDVTGFGLAGHLQSILSSSNLDAELTLEAVPWSPGAISLSSDGIHSSIYPANARLAEQMIAGDAVRTDPRFPLLFDPQTSGGLLAALPPEHLDDRAAEARALGQSMWVIGALVPAGLQGPKIRIPG
ncbi:MAG: selenide, water dikinase SelD [Caulobacter sp.]|nr:selenide, water dikinase SelD [Caulobacter sp.]